MATIKINKKRLYFPNVYYVNVASGLDENEGTRTYPFLTIGKAVSMCEAGDAIYLLGVPEPYVYEFSSSPPEVPISIIGDQDKTTIEVNHSSKRWTGCKVSLTFYRLILRGREVPLYGVTEGQSYVFHNCHFDVYGGYLGYPSKPNTIFAYNCLFLNSDDYYGWCRDDINVTNCVFSGNISRMGQYGPVIGRTTLVNDRFVESGTIRSKAYTSTPKFKDEGYYILDEPYTGEGFNPDGSPSTLGLYGGPYGWGDWRPAKILFGTNNRYFTIEKGALNFLSELDYSKGISNPEELFETKDIKTFLSEGNDIHYSEPGTNAHRMQVIRGEEGYPYDTPSLVDVTDPKRISVSYGGGKENLADKDMSTSCRVQGSNPFVAHDFSELGGERLAAYTVVIADTTTYPNSWKLQGSSDNENWYTLHSTGVSEWEPHTGKTYYIPRSKRKVYNYYRLVWKDSFWELAELILYKEVL